MIESLSIAIDYPSNQMKQSLVKGGKVASKKGKMMSVHTEIQTLYLTVYNRPADWEGLIYWTEQLEVKGLEAVNQAFTQVPEFYELYAGQSPEQQVNTLYQHLLGRDAEAGGRDYWATKLDEGISLAKVARFIADAAEGEDATALEARIDNAQNQTYGEIIDTLYAGYYGRAADKDGKAYWLDAMKSAEGGLDPIIEAFGNSDEYVEQYGGMDTELQLDALYNKLFSRDPDPEGAAYWASKLDSGDLTLSSLAFTLAQAATPVDKEALKNNVQAENHPEPTPEPEPSPEYVEFPTQSMFVDRENGWELIALVSEVNQTTSLFLEKDIGTVNGFTASIGLTAWTFEEGSKSNYELFPQDDVLPPLFSVSYSGAGGAYGVSKKLSAVRVDGYERRDLSSLNDKTLSAHQDNFEIGADRELSIFDSPDSYEGLLDELLSADTLFARVIPTNPYFPVIEGKVDLDGFEEMLEIFDNLSVRREDNIYGSYEEALSDTLITGDSGSMQVIEVA